MGRMGAWTHAKRGQAVQCRVQGLGLVRMSTIGPNCSDRWLHSRTGTLNNEDAMPDCYPSIPHFALCCARSEWAQQMTELLSDLGPTACQVQPQPETPLAANLPVNTRMLAGAWESSQRVTKEDWWVRLAYIN